MGRISGDGDILVDIDEAALILKCTRRTVFNYIRRGNLIAHRIESSKKTWLEGIEVTRFAQVDKTLRSPKSAKEPSHWKVLRRFHTNLFPELLQSESSPK